MSIYIARSPYSSQFKTRRRLTFSFPQLGSLFKKKTARIAAGGSITPASGIIRPIVRRERQALSGASKTLSASRSSLGGTFRKIKAATLRFEFAPSMVIGGLFMIAVLFSLLYLAHFNQVATKGYDLKRLEADRQQLLSQYDIKNMKLAEAKSMANIMSSDRVSGMRRPSEVSFVRGDTVLASR